MKVMFITGSSWMRDELNNLKPFIKDSGFINIFTMFRDELVYPEIYWYEGDYLFPYLEKIVETEKIDMIIGYSAGGYIGYHLCNKYKIKGLHFNPAMASSSEAPTLQLLPNDYKNIPAFNDQAIIIGENDRRYKGGVDGDLVLQYLEYIKFGGHIHVIPNLEHDVPSEIFTLFFKKYRKMWFKR